MSKIARKGKTKRADIASDDHLLNELADLLLENESAALSEVFEGRVAEICEEITLRYKDRNRRSMSHPIPKFSSREKLFKVTREFGLDLFPHVGKETFAAWDLPYSHKYSNVDGEEDKKEGDNPYAEIIAKAEIFAEDVISILEIADSEEVYEDSPIPDILEAIKICESCWDDQKYFGINSSIEEIARSSIFSADIYLSLALNSLFVSKAETKNENGENMFIVDGDDILLSVNIARLYNRQSSLIYEAQNLAEIELDDMAAECLLGALAACGLMVIDYVRADMDVFDEEETKHYMATKAHAYDMVINSSVGFLPDIAVKSDVANLDYYTDESLFSEDG